ncbi:Late expression factor 4 [Trabala vishnou gigantina nucleopolyhedrovirus]|uniref:Late expression factor 4 n=1 Tax=Trabala vishnou gigantina nucleopolyhedrovirus TaxID=2863583 RepID=UPI002481ADFA|nr:Late expression factor 4 [Trabala vishnou gigantina nucleopolyhedrovirus]QYC92663.1 Late expression factor 4 [Trabala vishnou gigantina nucleopolyhedrovirus]
MFKGNRWPSQMYHPSSTVLSDVHEVPYERHVSNGCTALKTQKLFVFLVINPDGIRDMSSYVEKEISYSINLSQDLLYLILSSYISKNFTLAQEYVDCVDENDVRNRLLNNKFESTLKTVQSLRKTVHVCADAIAVPLIERVSVERGVSVQEVSPRLKKILTCCVYRSADCPDIEIKFEKVYLDTNLGDRFDSLMASKQIALLNLLQSERREKITKNSHLGSDEIYVYMRLEYEYQSDKPCLRVLDYLAQLVHEIDKISSSHNISPLLPYTTLKNNIIYRKFYNEVCIIEKNDNYTTTTTTTNNNNNSSSSSSSIINTTAINNNCVDVGVVEKKESVNFKNINNCYRNVEVKFGYDNNILKWANKLDGIRGKGLLTRNFIIIFMDDMRIFSDDFIQIFPLNNVVAFQCELVNNEDLYITDLLHVFKYTYNNRVQYECSMGAYDVEPLAAVECIDRLRTLYSGHDLQIKSHDGQQINVKFQRFMNPPLRIDGYCTMATDGFIALDCKMNYVKYKYNKTIELEYNANENVFYSLNGPLNEYKIITTYCTTQLEHNKIYEAIINKNTNDIIVVKIRRDRLIPQSIQ